MNTRTPAMPANDTPSMGAITAVEPDSFAAQVGVQPGDGLLAINDEPVEDVIDVQYHGADDWLELTIQRGAETLILAGERDALQPLGLSFAHPTFDIDIRRCNNLCPFCFVLQMAPRMRRTLHIKDDDYRYSFLFGHYVTLTNLSDHDWQRIKTQHLSPLFVSVHATDPAIRAECLGNKNPPDVLAQIRELGEHHFTVHTQLVITPGLNDGAIMEQSVRDLAALWPTVESISIVPVGLTKHHRYGKRPQTPAEMATVLDQCEAWRAEYMEQLGVRLVYPTDEWYLVAGRELPTLDEYDDLDDLQENGLGMVRHFLDEWAEVQATEIPVVAEGPALETKLTHLTLVTAALFAPVLAETAAALSAATGVKIDVIPIRNERLGETITVAGLLMAEDVLAALTEQSLGEVVILPRIMFDHPDGISLDDLHPQQVAQKLDRPVALADLMGDIVDVLTGNHALTFDPAGGLIRPDAIARVGGWAVEKYL